MLAMMRWRVSVCASVGSPVSSKFWALLPSLFSVKNSTLPFALILNALILAREGPTVRVVSVPFSTAGSNEHSVRSPFESVRNDERPGQGCIPVTFSTPLMFSTNENSMEAAFSASSSSSGFAFASCAFMVKVTVVMLSVPPAVKYRLNAADAVSSPSCAGAEPMLAMVKLLVVGATSMLEAWTRLAAKGTAMQHVVRAFAPNTSCSLSAAWRKYAIAM